MREGREGGEEMRNREGGGEGRKAVRVREVVPRILGRVWNLLRVCLAVFEVKDGNAMRKRVDFASSSCPFTSPLRLPVCSLERARLAAVRRRSSPPPLLPTFENRDNERRAEENCFATP